MSSGRKLKPTPKKSNSIKNELYDRDSDDADENLYGPPDASNSLSYAKVKFEIDKVHPRKSVVGPDGDHDLVPFPCCKTKIGCFSCCYNLRTSDLSKDAPGIVLYFQFLKYMGAVFSILLVLGIPSMIFFYHGQSENNIKDFNSAISALSIGNIEAAKPACAIGKFDLTEAASIDRKVSLVLSCPTGLLNSLNDIG